MVKDRRVKELLDRIYDSNDYNFNLIQDEDKRKIEIIVNNIDYHKAVASALITSLVKKVLDPSQDVRYHKVNFGNQEWDEKGYSARTFDTQNITPWMKRHFKRWAMKESAWLTRSIEQPYPFTLDFPGHIKKKKVKEAFLGLLNRLEDEFDDEITKKSYAEELLTYMIQKMKERYEKQMRAASYKISEDQTSRRQLTIQRIIDAFSEFFKMDFEQKQGVSYLPVIAIYSLLQVVMPNIKRYEGKILGKLRAHTASDRTSFALGDIEIFNDDGTRFEVFEIKHNITLRLGDIEDVIDKILKSKEPKLERYYILTTAFPDINPYEKDKIKHTCEKFLVDYGVEIIPNGVVMTIKYFLRLLEKPERFLDKFTVNLQEIFRRESMIKEEHLLKWKEILKRFGFDVKE